MQRTLEPELLDALPPNHPDALHNRRDLRLTNQILGTHRWIVRTLPRLLRPGETALELGAGTGELADQLRRRGVCVAGLDLWPPPANWPADMAWHRHDLRTFEQFGDYAAVFGNLIYHQFSDLELAQLGEKLRATARVILACEPQRRRLSQIFYRRFAPLFGANHVSLHDAHVSIAAGFKDHELPHALGLADADWDVRCNSTMIGAYRMVAVRRA
jgi:hypothetical protein